MAASITAEIDSTEHMVDYGPSAELEELLGGCTNIVLWCRVHATSVLPSMYSHAKDTKCKTPPITMS